MGDLSTLSGGAPRNETFRFLWEDGERVFYRMQRPGQPIAVLAMRLAADHPTSASLDRMVHEYSLKEELQSAWALRPLELAHEDGQSLLLFEDSGSEPLSRLLGAPIEVGRFLRLAIRIADALDQVHLHGFVHKDLKPANILVNPNGEVRLTGFGIASRLPRERQAPEPPETIAGTLAYMAPEQTGRMNRSVDSRSDLYALGVTLYEMLTGSLPFAARDPMGWVHCHIARQPDPPGERAKDVPAPVSAIVMKLLSKTAEDRYQTAGGLGWDLSRCLTDWEAAGRVDVFSLGTHDRAKYLLIPERLYGRDVEISTLLDAFERVVAQGTPEMVLVSGYSGIGKSSVVNELHKVIALPRGIFISGKFDQRLRDIPYSTLAQAFQRLIRQVLNGQASEIERLSDAIRQAIGKQGRLLTDLIPELESLIGPQPPVQVLTPLESRLRFQSVFQNFVGVFARAEHPLVIFIDDLQWLDPATLTVVDYLITHPDTRHLLLIGAYRDNEVRPEHPLMDTLGSIRGAGTAVNEIVLDRLSVDDFNQLLCDAFRCAPEQALPLAELVHRKTEGNPFFAGQFLTNLVEEGFLEFEPSSNSWRWDLASIDERGFAENVVDLMARRLQRLSPNSQGALKLLACLGSHADFGTLAKVRRVSEAEVHADFADTVCAGAILATERGFKFLHDRVQEAAYALIPPESRAEQHLRVGRLLLSSLSGEEITGRIFDLVNQLNLGSRLMANRSEQRRVAALNLQAAKKAKASTAYSSSCHYLAAAAAVLGQQGWQDSYELTFCVWSERAECEFLNSNLGEAARWIDELLLRAQSKIHCAEANRLKMVLHLLHGDNALAVRTALECLQMFDIELPECPTNEQVQQEYDAVLSGLDASPIESLLDLPMMEDAEMREVMNVFSTLCRSAYFIDSNLCQTIACRMVNVTQKHGTTESAVIGYALLSIFPGPVFHRYRDGEEFARLAVAVAEKYGFASQNVGANFMMQMAVLWTQPIDIALRCVDTAIRTAQETGEIVYACYSLEHRLTDLMARGDHLDEMWLESVKALEFVQRINFRHVCDILASVQPFIQRLRGHAGAPPLIEEAAIEARLLEGGIAVVICFHWILQIQRHFLLGDSDAALECAAKAQPLLWSARCHIQFANYCLYYSLSLAEVHGNASTDRRAEIRAEVAANVQVLERWAQSCAETFGHKHLLLSGELVRLDGRATEALRLYERAARSAGEHGFIQDQALANELAGRCCLASGLERAAHAYLSEARDCYYRWGALGKVTQLDQRYPASKPAALPVSRATIEESAEQLDVATIIKTSQAISSEMKLENLIKSLMVISVEHAGAERGLLILPRGAEHQIEAEASIQRGNVVVNLVQQSLASEALPESVLHYVVSTREGVILDDASVENRFSADPYVRQKRAHSVLCLPLLKQAKLIGVLYLENNLAPRVFVPGRIAILKLLAPQAAIALENARLYRDLAEREAKIRRLLDANIIGIFMWRLDGGTPESTDAIIYEVNDAFLRMVEYHRDDFSSGCVHRSNLTPPEWHERTAQAHIELKRTGAFQAYEKEYFRKDGSRVPVLVGSTCFDETRNHGVSFVLDLSERKRAEEELRCSREQLAQASRIATVAELSASIAHELNQPLQAVVANGHACMRWLTSAQPNVDEARRIAKQIVSDAHAASDVIRRIRALFKQAAPAKTNLDVNGLILRVCALMSDEIHADGISLKTELAENVPMINADAVQIQQVIVNLLRNAIEASAMTAEQSKPLVIRSRRDRNEVVVDVQDRGIGLADCKTIFEPFVTTKEAGMGMGLAICQSIIEAHSGRIWVVRNGTQGVTFCVGLPIDVSDTA